jgi:hypothetical protein
MWYAVHWTTIYADDHVEEWEQISEVLPAPGTTHYGDDGSTTFFDYASEYTVLEPPCRVISGHQWDYETGTTCMFCGLSR